MPNTETWWAEKGSSHILPFSQSELSDGINDGIGNSDYLLQCVLFINYLLAADLSALIGREEGC